jgi:hypothetical protein
VVCFQSVTYNFSGSLVRLRVAVEAAASMRLVAILRTAGERFLLTADVDAADRAEELDM